MQLEDYFDFFESGDIRIKGHRIGIEHVVKLYHEGFNPEQVAQHYPGLSLEKIYATITYYLHNQEEIECYIAEGDDWREEQYQQSLLAYESYSPVESAPRMTIRFLLDETEVQNGVRPFL